jgi:hypothetical protein
MELNIVLLLVATIYNSGLLALQDLDKVLGLSGKRGDLRGERVRYNEIIKKIWSLYSFFQYFRFSLKQNL